MDCLICGAAATKFERGFDGVHFKCVECGELGVSGTLLATLRGRRFDVEQTRAWLTRRREAHPDEFPKIGEQDAFLAV